MSLLDDIEEEARSLMDAHGLTDWTLKFDRASRQYGYCNWRDKVISLSNILCCLNSREETTQAILHEIAHALEPYESHNIQWLRTARAIGYVGNRCYDKGVIEPKAKYKLICPNCKKFQYRNRIGKRRSCFTCGGPYFDVNFLLVYEENK